MLTTTIGSSSIQYSLRRKLNEIRSSEIKRDVHPTIRRKLKLQGWRMRTRVAAVYKTGSVAFLTQSGSLPYGRFWRQHLIFQDLEYIKRMMREDKSITDREAVLLAIDGDIKCYCTCPSFRYFFSYIAWNLGLGIQKETRFPIIRNPQLKGVVCKHLMVVFQELPNWVDTIALRFRKKGVFD